MTELFEHDLAPVFLLLALPAGGSAIFAAVCLVAAIFTRVLGVVRNDREGRTASRAMLLIATYSAFAMVIAAVIAAGLIRLIVSVL